MNGQYQLVSLAAAAVGLILAVTAAPAEAKTEQPGVQAGKIRVLVVTGGHGFDKKVFPKTFAGHADIEITFSNAKRGAPSVFEDISKWPYDVMVLYNFNQRISARQKANFIKLLDRGVGLVVLHHAIAAYPDWIEYTKIIGATYVLKDGVVRDGVKYERPVWKHGVKMKIHVEDAKHPITAGLADREVLDESYKKWAYHKGNHLLLSTDCPLNNKQIAWTRTYAKARVFVNQLGHGPGIFREKTFRTVIARGIRWTARRLGKPAPAPADKKGAK